MTVTTDWPGVAEHQRRLIRELKARHGLTNAALGELLGRNEDYVADRLRIWKRHNKPQPMFSPEDLGVLFDDVFRIEDFNMLFRPVTISAGAPPKRSRGGTYNPHYTGHRRVGWAQPVHREPVPA